MGKVFNISAGCIPGMHYMVDVGEKINKIKAMVDQGQYFTITCARQYGKTTTLYALEQSLKQEYTVISLDFQVFGASDFQTEASFVRNFCLELLEGGCQGEIPADIQRQLELFAQGEGEQNRLSMLFRCLSKWCGSATEKIVLLVDEADSGSRYLVFLDFLSQLRGYYIAREKKPAFHSVILAGVYDMKNLADKSVPEYKMNSPWNIAADFDVDMSLEEAGIAKMLKEYREDYQIQMDTKLLARQIYDYTSGYPFLVSYLCKLMDEKIPGSAGFPDREASWTREGFLAAVRVILSEDNTLFESLDNKLLDYPDLKGMLQELLLEGKVIEYIPGDLGIRMAAMFGFVEIKNHIVSVANRIFETRLYNGFLAEKSRKKELEGITGHGGGNGNRFVKDGRLDMELVLQKFVDYYEEVFPEYNEKFLEEDGRSLFLLYLKPIINGVGNYYIEARTRTNRRTDVIVDYGGQQHVIELKIWRGQEYHRRGEKQLMDYLELYHAKQGYLVSFNFNKQKKTGVRRIQIEGRVIIEAVV
ncbi:AAA-like domain-containing protein [Lachnospiraceae bacterium 29-84]